ncbi:hypothetical protein SAMN04489761_2402 [Tenacibaculum sp. MAR_2009_124]|uniref:hypothetical protein n=1 Tax=Tenacibaculum sp. MAR_2009_124 TaxID=1250059 RepID=UPI00089B2813|nr:hypothetical protein [Tenacibaculum sp. MAR_2009_124]SEC21747.1 hypothetical protein SAMN04489761_2402 [Tenacibaculum sp. MAR_2009_124]
MKRFVFVVCILFTLSCSKNIEIDPTIFNEELSVLENLQNGVSTLQIANSLGKEALYGVNYEGGFIFHVNEINGSLLVACNYSEIGPKSWGDHFNLTTSNLISDGMKNTIQIIEGNAANNSNVTNGFEFGSDNYVFKIAYDLNYKNHDDWFIPSKESVEAIYLNLHEKGMGNFDESLFYWTSSKSGYEPYVMSFDSNFNGEAFLGSCFNSNSIIVVRKINR